MSKKIALFGGSFDPPHEGHRAIARLLTRRQDLDEVWILPVYKHPLGKKLGDFASRLKSCRTFFKELGSQVKVKDLEKRLGGSSLTIRLIRYLQKKHPAHQFYFVMGEDAYRQRRQWKEFGSIQKKVELIVVPRGTHSPIPNISSTEIRKRIRNKKV